MLEEFEILENIANNFDTMGKNQEYMKEQITNFDSKDKIKINFKFCHVTISKNGGLMAICKKKGFLDMSRNSIINRNIIVMHQDANYRYYIPISWNYNKRYIVCIDFTPKDELYAILNDGGIFKIKYYERTYKEILTSQYLKEGVLKAKLFEKGFIALTQSGNFYYIKDIKNPVASTLINLGLLIKELNPKIIESIEFVGISSENSSSKRFELIITNPEKNGGVFKFIDRGEGNNLQVDIVNNYREIVGGSYILTEKPQRLLLSIKSDECKIIEEKEKKKKKEKESKIENEKEEEIKKELEDKGKQAPIGVINALAVSPSGETIAFYNKEKKTAFLMRTNFKGEYKEIHFNYKEKNYSQDKKEIDDALNYEEGCQFLFCGEDTLALSRQRYIILTKQKIDNALVYLIYEGGKSELKHGTLFSKCITETDGLRFLTNEGVFLISQVPKELYDLCNPFSKSPLRKFIQIYKNSLLRKYTADKDIFSLSSLLAESIVNLENACANIFWTEANNPGFQKEIQLFVLKAAQYLKKFVNQDEFNYHKFVGICKDLRVINNLRNDKKNPIFITFREYKETNLKLIISKLIKYRNFKLAADISKFLGYGTKKVLHKYVIAIMKKEIKDIEKAIDEDQIDNENENENKNENERGGGVKKDYKLLFRYLEKVPGISYIKLAKKAAKYKGEKLSRYLIEQEKSDLIKIPQLLKLKKPNYEESLKIAFDTYDFNAVIKVMYKIIKEGELTILKDNKYQKIFPKILLYLKKYNKKEIENYLQETNNIAELLYFHLEKYFDNKTYDGRNEEKDIICKLKYKDAENNSNFDGKFMKKYLERLEKSLLFKHKAKSPEVNYIHYAEIEPYSVSIYDCFKSAIKKGEILKIEKENKSFDYSSKKLNLLRLRSLLEVKRPDILKEVLEKTPLKKMGLTHMHLGEIYFEYKYYDQATEELIKVKEPYNYIYVFDMLKNMEKYKEALEFTISSKDNNMKEDMVKEILRKQPSLEKYANELCETYKVNLQN